MQPPHRRVALFLLACVLAGGCSQGDEDSGTASARSDVAEGASGEVAAGAGVPAGEPLQAVRSLIQRADLSVRVDDVDATVDRAVALAEDRGGFLSGQAVTRDEHGASGTVELHVPADGFRSLLDELSGLGDLLERNVDTEDVTDQVVDLRARLETAQASVARVRELLEAAASVEEVVRLEGEVTARETTVEQLAGQLQVLDDQVAMSVILLRLGEVVPPPAATDPRPSEDIPGFRSGLQQGWARFQDVVGVLFTVIGFALPFLVLAAPVLVVVVWFRRRAVRAI